MSVLAGVGFGLAAVTVGVPSGAALFAGWNRRAPGVNEGSLVESAAHGALIFLGAAGLLKAYDWGSRSWTNLSGAVQEMSGWQRAGFFIGTPVVLAGVAGGAYTFGRNG